MKITVDIDKLLAEGQITQDEYKKWSQFAQRSTGSLAFNLLVGFGVVAVAGASLALVPSAITAILIGAGVLAAGIGLSRAQIKQWALLSSICVLVGAIMFGGGVLTHFRGSQASIIGVSFVYGLIAIFGRSVLLAILATLTLSASIGARTGYWHATYTIVIREPMTTVLVFGALAGGLQWAAKKLSADMERIAIAASRTSLFLVHLALWVGSLWGDRNAEREVVISDTFFAVLWTVALVAMAVWSWRYNRRWVLNATAVFGGIHFYTQWFEHLRFSPESVLGAGIIALLFALVLRSVNSRMRLLDQPSAG